MRSTSAPRSASSMAPNGTGPRAASSTTRTPSSGPLTSAGRGRARHACSGAAPPDPIVGRLAGARAPDRRAPASLRQAEDALADDVALDLVGAAVDGLGPRVQEA